LPRRSTVEIRLQDIETNAEANPVLALHQIAMFRELYGADTDSQALTDCQAQALEALTALRATAIEEERWLDAASYDRSLAAAAPPSDSSQVPSPKSQFPNTYTLAYARQQLAAENTLGAFLAAVEAASEAPLGARDALLFLDAAVKARQRGTAAFFLKAADAAGAARQVPEGDRAFAQGADTVARMVTGVATVIVDRGYRIEKGRGFSDRVLGSAFFVDASGLLITNYHVVESEVDPEYEGYSRMYIRMGDSTSARLPARVIGWDKALDLALIKAEFSPDYVFSVADRVLPQVGDTVLAIGSPAGLEKTVTRGIVSAPSRRFLQVGDVIQIDAAVNHGNSGGPVVDTAGRLVGIVFAGVEQFQGLNFAVPAERLAAALPAMLAGGKAERPWLGLSLSETRAGVEIVYVAPSTPAAEVRIKEGSLIRAIDGRAPQPGQGGLIPALQDLLFGARPGELVRVELEEPDGQRIERTLISAARPGKPLAEAARRDSRERMAAPLFGIILSPNAGASMFTSFLIKKVVRGSVADETGLSENDPMSIRGFRVFEDDGYAVMDIDVKKRRMGYLETSMALYAPLETPDTL
jgi:S1-C subfamily serine protease